LKNRFLDIAKYNYIKNIYLEINLVI